MNLQLIENIVRSPYPDINLIENKTLPELMWDEVNKNTHWKSAELLICGITGKSFTYQEVYNMSKGFASGLIQKLGLQRNDIVGIILPNCPEFLIILLGILDAGCIASLMNPTYTIYEFKNLLNTVEAKCIVTIETLLPTMLQLKNEFDTLEHLVTLDGSHSESISYQELLLFNSDIEFLKGTDTDMREQTATIPFSSGTTGLPKGVMLSHFNLCTNLLQQVSSNEQCSMNSFTLENEQERVLGILPFFHSYGMLNSLLIPMFKGAKIMIIPKFEPKTFILAARKIQPTQWYLVPPLINFIVNSPEFSSEDFELTHTIMCGAAPLGTSLINRFLEKAGKYIDIMEGYGMTELSPVCHVIDKSSKNSKLGSVGRLIPNTIAKIVDLKTGKSLGPEESGEIWIKGPQIMKGYHKNEEATQEVIDVDGFLHTGDIGRYDVEGYFYVEDRLKEIIKSKGFQIAPSELENVLRQLPGVVDVAVIGVMNNNEEVPCAYIVRKSGVIFEDDIHNFINEKVAHYKRLRGGIQFVNSIPRSAAGKTLRKEILKNYMEKNKMEAISEEHLP